MKLPPEAIFCHPDGETNLKTQFQQLPTSIFTMIFTSSTKFSRILQLYCGKFMGKCMGKCRAQCLMKWLLKGVSKLEQFHVFYNNEM